MSWGLVAKAGVSVGSWALNKYGNKKKGGGEGQEVPQNLDTRNEDQKRKDAALADFVTKYLPQYQPGKPYNGQRTAGMSGYEGQGLEFLQQFLNSPALSQTGEAGKKQVMDTLAGNFDPRSQPSFQASRDLFKLSEQDAIDTSNQQLGARNKYFSSERMREVGDITKRTALGTNALITQYLDNERERQMRAVPQALEYNALETQAPLDRATAATTIGALPRQIEQYDLEAKYKDFIRQQDEFAGVISAASGVSSSPTSFRAYEQPQSSGFEKYLAPLLNYGAKAAGSYLASK